jgi:nucleotide-binding universal stress UspA family protein
MRFLVAYDGSDAARRALARAIELGGSDVRVHVLAVEAPTPAGRLRNGPIAARPAATPLELALKDARALLEEHDVEATLTLRRGDPETILREEAQAGYDAVFVGSRPLSDLDRLLLGSVTSWIAHHATCDVVITR